MIERVIWLPHTIRYQFHAYLVHASPPEKSYHTNTAFSPIDGQHAASELLERLQYDDDIYRRFARSRWETGITLVTSANIISNIGFLATHSHRPQAVLAWPYYAQLLLEATLICYLPSSFTSAFTRQWQMPAVFTAKQSNDDRLNE